MQAGRMYALQCYIYGRIGESNQRQASVSPEVSWRFKKWFHAAVKSCHQQAVTYKRISRTHSPTTG